MLFRDHALASLEIKLHQVGLDRRKGAAQRAAEFVDGRKSCVGDLLA
jgi:hypothetical protein